MILIMNCIMLLIVWVGAHQIESYAGWRYDGFYAVYNADYHVLPYDPWYL